MADLIDRGTLAESLFPLNDKDAADIYRIIEDAPSVNRWIPCSERLPEDFVWCLVCMSDGCIRIGKWNGEYDEQGVWWVSHPNSGGKLYRIKNVPYWMPLPEPPEKERCKMKLIYADDLLKEIEGLRGTNHNVLWRDGYYTAIYDVKCIIENMPRVVRKPAPPKKGKWLEVSMEVGEFHGDVNGKCELTIVSGKCSECKCYSYSLMQYTPQMPPFCSKCGAIMK